MKKITDDEATTTIHARFRGQLKDGIRFTGMAHVDSGSIPRFEVFANFTAGDDAEAQVYFESDGSSSGGGGSSSSSGGGMCVWRPQELRSLEFVDWSLAEVAEEPPKKKKKSRAASSKNPAKKATKKATKKAPKKAPKSSAASPSKSGSSSLAAIVIY